MKRVSNLIGIVIVLFLVEGCATVKDVQRSTDLMRTDNELARIINDGRSVQGTEKGDELSILGDHAKAQGDILKETDKTVPDAIAYYRIASTAYWQSWEADVVEKIFNAANTGKELCSKLDKDAPDRDCLFLQLVIPFAGLESENKTIHPQGLLNKVNFSDGNATEQEIAHMKTIYASLNRSKRLLDYILSVGNNNRLMTHEGMKGFYCRNSEEVISRYRTNWEGFIVRVKQFYTQNFQSGHHLGFTQDDAVKLKLVVKKTAICMQ